MLGWSVHIGRRYSREVLAFFQNVGIERVIAEKYRGWTVSGNKSLQELSCAG